MSPTLSNLFDSVDHSFLKYFPLLSSGTTHTPAIFFPTFLPLHVIFPDLTHILYFLKFECSKVLSLYLHTCQLSYSISDLILFHTFEYH